MLFSKTTRTRKQLVGVLFLLVFLIAIPLLSVQASVGLLYFRAVSGTNFIRLEWETAQEIDNLGFNLYRGLSGDFSNAQKLNSSLIPSQSGGATGAFYQWTDQNVVIGTTYTYWLEDIDTSSNVTLHDPITAAVSGGGAIPTQPAPGNNSTNTPTPTRTPTGTPTPTTQSDTGASATPTRLPTVTPTAQQNSSNPTATTASSIPQSQPTAVSNDTAQNTAAQSAATSAPEAANGEPTVDISNPSPETLANSTGIEGQATPLSLAQAPTEEDSGNITSLGQQIGQNQNDNQGVVSADVSNPTNPNRTTVVIMALIASIILLFAGAGGVIFLLLNRTKQTRN